MNREIIDINDYTILLEEASADNHLIDSCFFDEPVIALAFYGAGDVGTDEVVRKYKSMTPGEQKNEVKLSESYVLWLIENEQLDEASLHSNLKALLHPEVHQAVKNYLHHPAE